MMQPPLESGACLDSPYQVPKVLQKPAVRSNQLVRVDQVVSTSTMTSGQVIGFLYTTADGGSWLGERTSQYTSAANATEINAVLAATHAAGVGNNTFPPQTHYGVQTKPPQIFRVQTTPAAMRSLEVELVPCVVWPTTRPLPDPGIP